MKSLKKVYNVLLFPSGSEIAFEINNALKYSKFVNIFAGSSLSEHSEFVYKNYCSTFPTIKDVNFIDFLNDFITKNEIDYIFPAMDMVQVFLMNHQSEIKAKIVSSPIETVNICRSKKKTYELMKNENFIPKVYRNFNDIKKFPVFAKPSVGQGSQGIKIINNKDDLDCINSLNDDYIICEYLPGQEFTIDCFTDKNRKLRVIEMRSRDRIRTGISVRSTRCNLDDKVKKIAEVINNYFVFQGAWFFQIKKDEKNEYKLMEVSPRIPGTMGLSRNLGINFPMLTLFDMMGFDLDIINNNYDIVLDRAFINRYRINYDYQNVYIDFDDTITNNNKLNLTVIQYIYQLLNEKKNIYLLTRHSEDIYQTLKKYKLSKDIFTEIIHIDSKKNKSDYIKKDKSIFIDDSFKERIEVKNKLNIPVFDVDMIESLLDWRV